MNESCLNGFPPIANREARILILGSMPGRASLAAGQYYAHAQNAFWPIISELLGVDARASYRVRAMALKSARIALWDVLRSCAREGSLDTMIAKDSEVANDFASFFGAHPRITRVYFNGAKAEACFRRHVLPQIGDRPLGYFRLPSTSPANASMRPEQKLLAWRAILGPVWNPHGKPSCGLAAVGAMVTDPLGL